MSYVRIKPDVLDALSTEERLAEWERLMTEIALVAGEVLFDGAEGAGAHLREVRLRLDVNLGEAS